MIRPRRLQLAFAMIVAVTVGGCSLVVDFDRSLLIDGGVDTAVDIGMDADVGGSVEAGGNTNVPSEGAADAN